MTLDLRLPPRPPQIHDGSVVVIRLPAAQDLYEAEWSQEVVEHVHLSNPGTRYVDVEWEWVTLRYDFGEPRPRRWWEFWR